ncbi:MAG TPA: hypothetical protein VJ824_08090 [Bacillota bacterium]|nr:hypothetical protein [Bacillota bacterium]
MTLYDVLNNWLQLKIVADLRPDDEAAQVSLEHVADILDKEHQVKIVSVNKKEDQYEVIYTEKEIENKQSFPARVAEILLQFIKENPERYEFN